MASLVDPEPAQNSHGFLSRLKAIPVAAIFSLFLVLYVVGRSIYTHAHVAAILAAAFVAIGSIVGYFAGGALARTVDRSIDQDIRKRGGSKLLQSIDSNLDTRYDNFLTFSAIATGLYITMYFEAIKSFEVGPDAILGLPVNPVIVLVTAITIFFLNLFCVRYASYVKMTKCLESVVREAPERQRLPDEKALIDSVREVVFRDAQLYEPPGNVFVTVGITATFLGLAIALIGLDLPGLLESRARSTASLAAFVACMGLALGMSMLGVMTALAAQWLRGYGAGEGTEDLLMRADRCVVPIPGRRPDMASQEALSTQAETWARQPDSVAKSAAGGAGTAVEEESEESAPEPTS